MIFNWRTNLETFPYNRTKKNRQDKAECNQKEITLQMANNFWKKQNKKNFLIETYLILHLLSTLNEVKNVLFHEGKQINRERGCDEGDLFSALLEVLQW